MKTLPVSQAKDFNVWYDDIVKRNHTTLKGVTIMAAYTIEDIELIRRKSGISYQEAVWSATAASRTAPSPKRKRAVLLAMFMWRSTRTTP